MLSPFKKEDVDHSHICPGQSSRAKLKKIVVKKELCTSDDEKSVLTVGAVLSLGSVIPTYR